MNGKGRKLFRSAVGILTSVMMMGAYTTTAMASGIGVIDAKDMLDIHAEANTASAVVGQVMEDGHVAILASTTTGCRSRREKLQDGYRLKIWSRQRFPTKRLLQPMSR